jgi:hypothetical protein
MQRLGEAGEPSGRGIARRGAKRSRRCDGRAALPDARACASETERQSESDLVSEAPRFQKRPQTWRTWVVHSDDAALIYGGSLRVWLVYPGAVAGGRLRVPAGWAVGVEPAVNPVKRIMVNVGDVPFSPGRWWRRGKARCRLMGAGRARPPDSASSEMGLPRPGGLHGPRKPDSWAWPVRRRVGTPRHPLQHGDARADRDPEGAGPTDAARTAMSEALTLRRIGEPAELAATVAFLLSPAAA